ncbi:MAG TPA: MBL fold metallo-hydrolase [Candidatus Dormibacteraeota bacterium]|nr:MBL fold metallo-hydrolase [Candidatus Dormibacteraeota bacterium]
MQQDDRPEAMNAVVSILVVGKADRSGVESTVSLVRDGDTLIVIDPGMVADRRQILDPLAAQGVSPEQVTDVVLSHHHPDHTLNAALFPNARVHDHWAVYHGDSWTSRPAEGSVLSPSVRLIETPGHTPQDITTLVGTKDGVVAFTHAWWSSAGPAEDPYAEMESLHASRVRVLRIADRIVPGHGAPFVPDATTPR